jgi:hypothetical protein
MSAASNHERDHPREQSLGGYLTVPEVADLARCEHKAVRRAIASGLLVAFRPAHKLLIRELDALAWIESRPVVVAAAAPEHARHPGRQRSRPRPGSVDDLLRIEREATGR